MPSPGAPAILFGGLSSERLVSTASAQLVALALPEAELLFWDAAGIHRVSPQALRNHSDPFTRALAPVGAPMAAHIDALVADWEPQRALVLALHGGDGESGVLQARLEARSLAFTGAGAQASRIAFDKEASRRAVAAAGGAIADGRVTSSAALAEQRDWVRATLAAGHPVYAKPVADGSSVGLHRMDQLADFERVCETLRGAPDCAYLLESGVSGRELTVGVVEWADGVRALPASEVLLPAALTFGYDEKYISAAATEVTPAQIPEALARAAAKLALDAHQAVGCRGYSRTDCIWDGERMVFLEVNTLPGLTARSFITQQLQAAGHTMREFLQQQLGIARARAAAGAGAAP